MEFLTDPMNLVYIFGLAALTCTAAYAVYLLSNDVRFRQFQSWVEMAVNYIEQKFPNYDGPRKKELALLILREVRDRLKISLSNEELEMLLEANVRLMKNVAKMTPGTIDDEIVEKLTEGMED